MHDHEIEPRLRLRFRNWLADLDDGQLDALDENWENVMNDADLDRVDSWVTAGRVITKLRSGPGGAVLMTDQSPELVPTRVAARRNNGNAGYAGALWQDSRLVFLCEHTHPWQGEARNCANSAAENWPDRSRTGFLNPQYELPRLPDIGKADT